MEGDGFASRKFILSVAGMLISSVLVWYGKLDGVEYVSFNSLLAGAYMTSNVVEKIKGILNVK